MRKIKPANLSAQLRYEAAGNPPSSRPDSAISNCYPGLEFDFRNVWRRILEGIELHEADNYVVRTSPGLERLLGHRLLRIDGKPVITDLVGPQLPQGQSTSLTTGGNPAGVVAMEWSNALAEVLAEKAGEKVLCEFSPKPGQDSVGFPDKDRGLVRQHLRIRPLFARSQVTGEPLPLIDPELVQPGELTQSLCSPWQNDYRECACYYWAASRPDYINVELNERGVSTGNNWLERFRDSREYVPDDFRDGRLVSYNDLFQEWQRLLRFVIGGKDDESVNDAG